MFFTPWLSRLRRHGRRSSIARVQEFEPRCLLAVFTVNSIGSEADAYLEDNIPDITGRPAMALGPDDPGEPYSGIVTLRAAIENAELTDARDDIHFNISGDGPHRITQFDSFGLLKPIVIDGTTQPGALLSPKIELGNPNASFAQKIDLSSNSIVKGLALIRTVVELHEDGNRVSDNYFGITAGGDAIAKSSDESVTISGNENTVAENVFGNVQVAVAIRPTVSANDNVVRDNLVGLDPGGLLPMRNDFGISIIDTTFGATKRANRNLIEDNVIANSNFDGLQIQGNDNVVRGNIIGTNLAQTVAMGNSRDGIDLQHFNNVVENNVIAANGREGIRVRGNGEDLNATIRNNFIGTTATGAMLGNTKSGIEVFGVGAVLIEDNVIAFNGGAGVSLGGSPVAVAKIFENSIHSNGGLGIDYSTPLDTDGHGGDGLPNRPPLNLVMSVENGRFLASGVGQGGSLRRIDLYDSDVADPSGFGEGQRHLATFQFTVNPDGTVNLDQPFNAAFSHLTVTLTDAEHTSEFSRVLQSLTIVVNTNSDQPDQNPDPAVIDVLPDMSGNQISLRAAITAANENPGRDNILFDISESAIPIISLLTALPTITEAVVIDGTTQASHRVQLHGGNRAFNGLQISSGNSEVRGLAFTGFGAAAPDLADTPSTGHGILITGNGNNRIENNLFGGVQNNYGDQRANKGNGIHIFNSPSNEIRNNVISNSLGDGIGIEGSASSSNVIVGNTIGLDEQGDSRVANRRGIFINGAPNNRIGNGTAAGRNVIGGSRLENVLIANVTATGNQVRGNYIGLQRSGEDVVDNAGDGVAIVNAPNNILGGVNEGEGNVISYHDRNGVVLKGSNAFGIVVQGNAIGVFATLLPRSQSADINVRDLLGNALNGVLLTDGAHDNVIGRDSAGARNVIASSGGHGIAVLNHSDRNQILGNFIGVTPAAAVASTPFDDLGAAVSIEAFAVGNLGDGIHIEQSADIVIGSADADARNYINRNRGDGIDVTGISSANVKIQGNSIGVRPGGFGIFPNGDQGIDINGAPNALIGGATDAHGNLITGNLSGGIDIGGQSASGAQIQNNVLGIHLVPQPGGIGFGFESLAGGRNAITLVDVSNVLIGGTAAGVGNVIAAAAQQGIEIRGRESKSNQVFQNIIGLGPDGKTRGLVNGDGIRIESGSNNVIGGNTASHRNVITGAGDNGVVISGSTATGNKIQGNYIGTQSDGASLFLGLASPFGSGLNNILIDENASQNQIGGLQAGEGNVIAYARLNGVAVESGERNSILGNRFFRNTKLGIDLGDIDSDGPTNNDPLDSDSGPNRLQNFPKIVSYRYENDGTSIDVSLDSQPNSSYTIEVFENPSFQSLQGEVRLLTQVVTTNAQGHVEFTAFVPGQRKTLTATATDSLGNTSEFSFAPLVVNLTSDEADADPNDGRADVNLAMPGDQTTLRAAMQEQLRRRGDDVITFQIPGEGVPTIQVNGERLRGVVEDALLIDGSTQPNSHRVVIDGRGVDPEFGFGLGEGDGLRSISSTDFKIRNLTIQNFPENGLYVSGGAVLENVELLQNGGWGLNGKDGRIDVVKRLRVVGNGTNEELENDEKGGIRLEPSSSGFFTEDDENGFLGIDIIGNRGKGLHSAMDGRVFLFNAVVRSNKDDGIFVFGPLELGGLNDIERNLGKGITQAVNGIGGIVAEGLEVAGNSEDGISTDGRLEFTGSLPIKIHHNGRGSSSHGNGITLVLGGNLFHGESQSDPGPPIIEIYKNDGHGVQANGLSSEVVLKTVRIDDNQGFGISSVGDVTVAAGAIRRNRLGNLDVLGNSQISPNVLLQGTDDAPITTEGITPAEEAAAPHGGDGNQDGTPDVEQSNVASFVSQAGPYVTLAAAADLEFSYVSSGPVPSPADAPAGVTFDLGFFDFELRNLAIGTATVVDLLVPDSQIATGYWKFGSTPDDPLPHWYRFDFDGTTGAEFLDGGRRVRLHFVDGGRGDDDLTANGVIVDPGAPDVEPAFNPVTLTLAAANANTRLLVNAENDHLELVNAATNAVLLDLTADGVTQLTINGGREDNRLTVDFTNGNPLPSDGLFFNGGRQRRHDDLVLTGGSFDSVTHTFANHNDGTVTIDGSMITYTGLEPILDNLAAVDRVFEFAATNDAITLADAARVNNGRLKLTSVRSSESVEFTAPTGSLTIRSGAGNDSVTVRSLDALFVASSATLVIEGDDGKDSLDASRVSKSVTLRGGAGRDTLRGSAVDDLLQGGADRDFLYGHRGNDTLAGDVGHDELRGGDGDDSLSGGDGNDSIRGDAGADRLFGENDNDTLRGDAGDDTLLGGQDQDVILGGSGDDVLAGEAGRDLLHGESGQDTLFGGADNDTLRGGSNNDALLGEAGDDILFGDGGPRDTLTGGGGNGHDMLFGLRTEIDETFMLDLEDLLI